MSGNGRTFLTIGSILAAVVAVFAFVGFYPEVDRQLAQASMVLVGLFVIATLSLVSRYLDQMQSAQIAQIPFDESRARASLDQAITVDYHQSGDGREVRSWDLDGEQLLEQDPNLALAKLRIDIERELRRIAHEGGVDVDARRMSIQALLSVLAKQDLVGSVVVSAINDILPACNAAIHGGQITIATARSVLGVGRDLVILLRSNRPVSSAHA